MQNTDSIIYDLTVIGGAEIYVNDVRVTTLEELEEALLKAEGEL
jgi:hypothetical protein